MLLQRWEAKIRWKEKSPQPGIELTTTRSSVRHAHHWPTRVGHILMEKSLASSERIDFWGKGKIKCHLQIFDSYHQWLTSMLFHNFVSFNLQRTWNELGGQAGKFGHGPIPNVPTIRSQDCQTMKINNSWTELFNFQNSFYCHWL